MAKLLPGASLLSGFDTPPPSADLTGLSSIDALIAQQQTLIAQQSKLSQRSLKQGRRSLLQERRASRRETRLLKKDIRDNQVEAEPPLPTMTMAEVQRARDQEMRDAASRNGIRKTVMAGETGGYGAGISPVTGRRSLLA